MMKRTKWKVNKKEPPENHVTKIPDIPKAIYNLLSSNGLKLYMFYRYMVAHQNTDQIYALDSFCMNKKGLGWSKTRFYATKNELYRFGLIKTIQKRKKDFGQFDKRYIKVYFVVDDKYLSTAEIQRRTNGEKESLTKSNLKTPQFNAERKGSPTEIHRRTNDPYYGNRDGNALKKHINTASENEDVFRSQEEKNNNLPKCLYGRIFGKDFDSSRTGCINCEDEESKLYRRCRAVYSQNKQKEQSAKS